MPAEALYGIFTKRALNNFMITGLRIDWEFIKTLAQIKKAAALANNELDLLDDELCEAIGRAADEVISGRHEDEFPLDVFQAGAGTPWNMNMNEVLANRANQILGAALGEYRPVHPNDHVNMAQSSNDVIPNAIRITALNLSDELMERLNVLVEALGEKASEFEDVRKSSRTHTQDAVPISLGREFRAYASAMANDAKRLEASMAELRSIFLGGTAVGTGINTHPGYSVRVLRHLRDSTGLDLNLAGDFVEKTQFESDFLGFMDALAVVSVDLVKICNDLMLLSSGPRTGLGEISLPVVEPGSSIMPGKVNPSILECVNMVCFQVMGNRAAVENAAKFGTLDLNVYTPVIAFNLFNSMKWLSNALHTLTEKAIMGLEVNRQATDYYFDYSNAVATLLSPIIGYKRAAELAMEALRRGVKVRDLVVEKGLLSGEQIDELIEHSCQPNLHIVRKIIEKKEKER